MSRCAVFSAFFQLQESPAIVPFMIRAFRQDLYFDPAVLLEFPGSESNWFGEF
jgi:hypothetical protein